MPSVLTDPYDIYNKRLDSIQSLTKYHNGLVDFLESCKGDNAIGQDKYDSICGEMDRTSQYVENLRLMNEFSLTENQY